MKALLWAMDTSTDSYTPAVTFDLVVTSLCVARFEAVGIGNQKNNVSRFDLVCVLLLFTLQGQMINLLATLVVYQLVNCLEYNAIDLSEMQIQDSYSLENLCNILVNTCVLGFAIDHSLNGLTKKLIEAISHLAYFSRR